MKPILMIIKPLLFAIFIVPSIHQAGYSQWKENPEREALIETNDGMLVVGKILEMEGDTLRLGTAYGELRINKQDVSRLNGDQVLEDGTIVREHRITIKSNGNVIVDYLFPVSAKHDTKTIAILTPGKIMAISDNDGRKLSYTGKILGDFTRCLVQRPSHRISSVRITTLLANAATLKNGNWNYHYDYVPRTEQLFRLEATLPGGATNVATAPDVVNHVSNTLLWEAHLLPQSQNLFNVKYALP